MDAPDYKEIAKKAVACAMYGFDDKYKQDIERRKHEGGGYSAHEVKTDALISLLPDVLETAIAQALEEALRIR